MKFIYDPRYNIAYIALRERHTRVVTIKVNEQINVDVDADGMLYGVELLNAEKQLSRSSGFNLDVMGEAAQSKEAGPLIWEFTAGG